jgi:choline transport protein
MAIDKRTLLMVAAIHISEEVSQPGRRVPQVMGVTMIIGLLTVLPLMLVLMFTMTSLSDITSSPLPSLENVYQACVDSVQ